MNTDRRLGLGIALATLGALGLASVALAGATVTQTLSLEIKGKTSGKKPGAGWEPQMEELTFAQRPGSDQRPYDRLIGAALDGERWLFARQETVEDAWKIVDPVLGDAVPVHPYPKGSWGPPRPIGCCPTATTGMTRPAD